MRVCTIVLLQSRIPIVQLLNLIFHHKFLTILRIYCTLFNERKINNIEQYYEKSTFPILSISCQIIVQAACDGAAN